MRRNQGGGFSIFLFIGVIFFVWLYPFEATEELRDADPENVETLSTEEIVIEGGKIEDGHTMVSVRELFEAMDVSWEEEEDTTEAEREEERISFTIGETAAVINGEEEEMETPPAEIDDTVYVPVRFTAEAFEAEVSWLEEESTVLIEDNHREIKVLIEGDGAEEAQEENDTAETMEVYGISLGDSQSKVAEAWGDPRRVTDSHYSFEWYTYHDDYDNFRKAGIVDGEVAALYTNTNELDSPDNLELETSRNEVRDIFGEPEEAIVKGATRYTQGDTDETDLFHVYDGYLTIYYDVHREDAATAVQLIDEEVEQELNGYYGEGSEELAEDFSMQMFDLVNADRVKFDEEPLEWNEEVARAALGHSEDMAERGYFGHESPEGTSPFDRLDEEGLTYTRAGENIAAGQPSAIMAEQGLMNSEGHRRNILSSQFEELGVGTDFDEEDRPFFTQKFYTR